MAVRSTDRPESLASVRYEPAAETFREDFRRKEMRYFTKPTNRHSIRIIFQTATREWRTQKLQGKKLIRTAFGSTFDQAMIDQAMGGPEPG